MDKAEVSRFWGIEATLSCDRSSSKDVIVLLAAATVHQSETKSTLDQSNEPLWKNFGLKRQFPRFAHNLCEVTFCSKDRYPQEPSFSHKYSEDHSASNQFSSNRTALFMQLS